MNVIFFTLVLLCTSDIITGNHKVYNHQHRNSSILDHLLPTLKAATFVAEKSVPRAKAGESIFDVQGNIYDVLEEVRFYAHGEFRCSIFGNETCVEYLNCYLAQQLQVRFRI